MNSLNRIYRLVWNVSKRCWQVASELAKSKGRGPMAGALIGAFSGGALAELPQGGTVTAGSAAISYNGAQLDITQGTDRAALDWMSFSIGSGNTVNFIQPSASAIALNRVIGSDVSSIQGALNTNGQVFLINPNGVVFTKSAQVNVGGIVASTQNLSNADFMAGRHVFSGSSTASVENHGTIKAKDGGHIALIAAKIINTGSLTANKGSIGLAAGNKVTLDIGGPVYINVDEGALNASIEQGGAIKADGGRVYLTAKAAGNLAASVINQSGVIEAKGMDDLMGRVTLSAGIVNQAGTVDVSGNRGGQASIAADLLMDSGRINANGSTLGGSIRLKAAEVLQTAVARHSTDGVIGGLIEIIGDARAYLSGLISAVGSQQGGQIDMTGMSLTLAGVTTDTSGGVKAGTQRIGGGWQGNEADIANAQQTSVNSLTTLTNTGANGTVVVWSDVLTNFAGTLNAPGSNVEISGKDTLNAALDNVKAASLLLDPKNIEIKNLTTLPALDFLQLGNPNTANGAGFGTNVTELANGNLVVTAPGTTTSHLGRVYLYNSQGILLATIASNIANDKLGNNAPVVVGTVGTSTSSNFLINAPTWDGNKGAVIWVNGSNGLLADGNVGGVVSASNALVGVNAGDYVGGFLDGTTVKTDITTLSNGNYVVNSRSWNTSSGAVTWGGGFFGTAGTIDKSNSVFGNASNDKIGGAGIVGLAGGNYVIVSPDYQNGAVTWVDGARGLILDGGYNGVVDNTVNANNSLMGSTAGDFNNASITTLSTGNYVVVTPNWNNGGAAAQAGAVTFVRGVDGGLISSYGNSATYTNTPAVNTPILGGTISASNSVVGSNPSDFVGAKNGDFNASVGGNNVNVGVNTGGVYTLSNGNYVINAPQWGGNGRGAVVWVNGLTGQLSDGKAGTSYSGVISASNAFVGNATDNLGSGGIKALDNGNYVVFSPTYGVSKGAVKFFNGDIADYSAGGSASAINKRVGTMSDALAFVGTNAGDVVGDITTTGSFTELARVGQTVVNGVTLLNDNYVITSTAWFANRGAVTWFNGITGAANGGATSGAIGQANSLVGVAPGSKIGSGGVKALANGHYVVLSPDSAVAGTSSALASGGAITWGNGTQGVIGNADANNSIIGSAENDRVGSSQFLELAQGVLGASGSFNNFVVLSPNALGGTGAVTWFNGAGATIGTISNANSLVGNATGDLTGASLTSLSNGNYVVLSPNFKSGANTVGAVVWGIGTAGATGVLSTTATNARIGSSNGDFTGASVTALTNGNYVLLTPNWSNALGAVSWLSGTANTSGTISVGNALVGSVAGDLADASVQALANGNFLIAAPNMNFDETTDAGMGAVAVGTSARTGVLSTTNSLLGLQRIFGTAANQRIGSIAHALTSGVGALVGSASWGDAGGANKGAVAWLGGNLSAGTSYAATTVSVTTALVGTTAGDQLGSGGIQQLPNGRVGILSPNYRNGSTVGAGAITFVNGLFGNLVDVAASTGAMKGTVSSGNSLLGSRAGGNLGSSADLSLLPVSGRLVVRRTGDGTGGRVLITDGVATTPDAGNSINTLTVANPNATANDKFGSYVTELSNRNLVISNPTATVGGAANTGRVYLLQADGTLVSTLTGSTANDYVGGYLVGATVNNGVTTLSNGNFVVASPNWSVNKGAVTFGSGLTGFGVGSTVTVGSDNSLVGTSNNSKVGGFTDNSGNITKSGVTALSNGNYVVASTNWINVTTPGAVTWGSGLTGIRGAVSTTNSLIGSQTGVTIGSGGITALANGNFVISTPSFINGGAASVGVVTWANGSNGRDALGRFGAIGTSNSIYGNVANNPIGSGGIVALPNGNYAVLSPSATVNGVTSAGAVNWVNGANGQWSRVLADGVGLNVTAVGNQTLTGNASNDFVGTDATALRNGHVVIASQHWSSSKGAATWINGLTGQLVDGTYLIKGGAARTLSAGNSLIGTANNDRVGSLSNLVSDKGITALANGNAVISSASWNGKRGAVTFMRGSDGAVRESGAWARGAQTVSANNSFVGNSVNDFVGGLFTNPFFETSMVSGTRTLTNGNFAIVSTKFNGIAGAVTWVNAGGGFATGVDPTITGNYAAGTLGTANSVLGTVGTSQIGSGGITALTNGNFAIVSPKWTDNAGVADKGAVTWVNGFTGKTLDNNATVSAANSFVGSNANDLIGGGTGGGVTALFNGNYVIASPSWTQNYFNCSAGLGACGTTGDFTSAGAATWVNGVTGKGVGNSIGTLDVANSLVSGVTVDNRALFNNNKIGSGGVLALTNGNYVVVSPNWGNGTTAERQGAITWGNGTAGVAGHALSSARSGPNFPVTLAANSFDGQNVSFMGSGGAVALPNGNFVVLSPNFTTGGGIASVGAATWFSGASMTTGNIAIGTATGNSLVGTVAQDRVGSGGIRVLPNGNYAVLSPLWNNGATADAGAITFVNGANGFIAGTSSKFANPTASNSIVGTTANAQMGSTTDPNAVSVLSSSGRLLVQRPNDGTGGVISTSDGKFIPAPTGDALGTASGGQSTTLFSTNASGNSVFTPTQITTLLNAGTRVVLQANNDITVTNAITGAAGGGFGGSLMLKAGRNIAVNANIKLDNAALVLVSSDTGAQATNRDAGNRSVTLGTGVTLNAGNGDISIVAQGSNTGGGNFFNNTGSANPFTTTGRVYIYLPSFNDGTTTYATLNGITPFSHRYNVSFNYNNNPNSVGAATGSTALPTDFGKTFLLYQFQPELKIKPTNTSTSLEYNDTSALLTSFGNAYTADGTAGTGISGLVNGDTLMSAGITGTATFTVTGTANAFGRFNASTTAYDVKYNAGLASSLGYKLVDDSSQTGELTITPKTVTFTGTTATKDYDGNTNFTPTVGTITGVFSNETLGTTTATGVLTTGDKNAGNTGKQVTVTYTLANGGTNGSTGLASNYRVNTQVVNATINKKALGITNTTVANKTYDGLLNGTVTIGTLTGLVAGETLGTTTATGTFADKNAADGKNVTVAYTLVNGTNPEHLASNYSLANETKQANIAKKALSITAPTVADRDYNGSNVATVTVGTLSGFVTGETLGTTTAVGTFASKDASDTAQNVTVVYTLADKPETMTPGTPVCGGVPLICGPGAPVISPAVSASNYSLADGLTTAKINRKLLTITGSTVADKTYDGTTTAAVTAGTLARLVTGETLGTTTAAGTFASKNASDNTQNVTAVYTLANGTNAAHKASNYTLANQTLTGKINKRALTITGTTVADKIYNGNAGATITVGTLGNLVTGETLGTTTATGSFADRDVALDANGNVIAKNVTVAYTLVNGTNPEHLASNYSLANETKTANITKKTLTANDTTVANKVYDGNTTGTVTVGTLAGLIDGETLGATTATGTFADKDAANGKNVTVAYTLANGANAAHKASNYVLANETKTANITPKELTITGSTVADKTYDGTTTATVTAGTLAGLVTGETLGTTAAAGMFADKDVGNGKDVTVAYTLANGANAAHKAGNYSLANETKTASILQKLLSVVGTKVEDKTADGSTDAKLTLGTLTGLVDRESLNLSAIGKFKDATPAASADVDVTYTLADGIGGLARNYRILVETIKGLIKQKVDGGMLRTVAQDTQRPPALTGNTGTPVQLGTGSVQYVAADRTPASNSDAQNPEVAIETRVANGPLQVSVVKGGVSMPAGSYIAGGESGSGSEE